MSDTHSRLPQHEPIHLKTADFEHILERLISLAEDQGRDFFSYLLTMALIHLRDESREHSHAPH